MGQELEQAAFAASSRWIVPPLAGAVSGVAVVLVGQPFDTIKVRMQVLNQRALPTFQQCLRMEGVTGLYKGTTPQLPGSAVQHAVRMGSYGVAKEALLQVTRMHGLINFCTPSIHVTIRCHDTCNLNIVGHQIH